MVAASECKKKNQPKLLKMQILMTVAIEEASK
jgi:hypothetical protein